MNRIREEDIRGIIASPIIDWEGFRNKSVLVTGAGPTGVTGRAIRDYLENDYSILAPSSKELDLTDDAAVRSYFDAHQIDFVVHCATYRSNISQTTHMVDEELESNLRMYFALASQCDKYEKMVYLGSGAEYDKSIPIINIKENQFGESIPKDKYGLGKYIMNQHCLNSQNIYNLRIFGTLNPYERHTKNVVCNLCAKSVMGLPLTLKKDCRFSWIDVEDIASAIDYIFNHQVYHHDYNVALDQSYTLSEIAGIVNDVSQTKQRIQFSEYGFNKEYTCCVERFGKDIPIVKTNIKTSITKIYNHFLSMKDVTEADDLDSRWK